MKTKNPDTKGLKSLWEASEDWQEEEESKEFLQESMHKPRISLITF